MKLYCQLGNIVFDYLQAPSSMEAEGTHSFAELKPAFSLPILHDKGEELDILNLSFQFHRKFCDPEDMYRQLVDARQNAEVLALVFADGTYPGDFVIESVKRQDQAGDSIGTPISIDVDVTLKAVSLSSLSITENEEDKGTEYRKEPEGAPDTAKEDITTTEIVRT